MIDQTLRSRIGTEKGQSITAIPSQKNNQWQLEMKEMKESRTMVTKKKFLLSLLAMILMNNS